MNQKIAIMTDTNSGIMAEEAQRLGVFVVPMPFVVDGEEGFEGVSLDADRFYERQRAGANIVTSQPSIVDLGERWHELLGTYTLSRHFEGHVHVVDNQRISVMQRESAIDALRWVEAGLSAQEVCDRLHATKFDASIYIMVDTMAYLHKSGRITPAAAAIGSVLKIRPVLQIQRRIHSVEVPRTSQR